MTTRQDVLQSLDEWAGRLTDIECHLANIYYQTVSSKTPYFRETIDPYSKRPSLRPEFISQWAENQLLTRLKIPVGYFHRCPPLLQASQFNYWKNQYGGNKITLRYVDHGPEAEHIRGIITGRYNTEYDDKNTLPHIMKELFTDKTAYILCYSKDEQFTQLCIGFDKFHTLHDTINAKAGVIVTNSEIGLSCFHIRPFVSWCWNQQPGSYTVYDTQSAFSHYHSSKFNRDQISKELKQCQEAGQVGIAELLVKSTHTVANPYTYITKLQQDNQSAISSKIMEVLKEQWENEKNAPLLQVARSILEAVSHLPVFQNHLATELVGKKLDLFSNVAYRIEALMNEETERLGETVES